MKKSLRNYVVSTGKPGKEPLLDRLTSAYLKGEDADLNAEDLNVLKRWKVVRMLEFQHRPCVSHADIVRVLVKDFGITEVTAHKDITQAHKLFGSVERVDKEFKLSVYREWLEQLASLAEKKGDMKTAVAALTKASEIVQAQDPGEDINKGDKFYQMNLFFGNGKELAKKTIDLDNVQELAPTEFKEILNVVDHPRVDAEMMDELLTLHAKNEATEL